jgi:circadian clock protein KaiC
MFSVGINLKPYLRSKLLQIHASRPSLQGLEMHLLLLHKLIDSFRPGTVVVDPISSLITVASGSEVRSMLVRLLDVLKINGINAIFTALTNTNVNELNDLSVDAVSSLADTWIRLINEEQNENMRRSLLIVKSRGMGHSNKQQNFIINDKGIRLLNPNGINQMKKNVQGESKRGER